MDGEKRRLEILNAIANATKPVSASSLAKQYNVSRQVIVGDIALLRASGYDITATARGYVMYVESGRFIGKVAVNHTLEQTEIELLSLVNIDVYIIDVTVEHPYYGELTGQLNIRNKEDVNNFINDIKSGKAELLSSLTQGVHLHTISCRDKEHFKQAHEVLDELGILINNN